jgi:hypothetical protein
VPADGDPAGVLAEVRTLALARFPRDSRTLDLFFLELDRRLKGAPAAAGDDAVELSPGTFEELLSRLEDLLEALLVGEAHGLARR